MAAALQPRKPTKATKKKGTVTPQAIQVLTRLPGITAASLQAWLYSARVLEDDDDIYWDIEEYVRNGQQHGYGMEVVNIVRIVRDNVIDFEHNAKTKNEFRMILWHGTKQSVIAAILQTGFKIPTPKNQMFGVGLYFADRLSKSANYCDQGHKPKPGSTAFLLLCDVYLGNIYNTKNPKNGITNVPGGKKFDSLMCTGENIPDEYYQRELFGSCLPCGPTIKNTKFPAYTVKYNEFIVYDADKVRIKYLVEVKFHSAPIP